jgi:preprotein translocase subunit SecG
MLYNILLIVQIVVSAGIIVLVLMQQGKGADAGAAFGSGASGTVFGSRGSANFLSRTTAILATVFFLNSTALAFLASGRTVQSISIMDSVKSAPAADSKPAVQTSDVPSLPASKDAKPAEASVPPAVDVKVSDVPAAPASTIQPAAPTQNPAENAEKPVQNSK